MDEQKAKNLYRVLKGLTKKSQGVFVSYGFHKTLQRNR